MVRKDSWQGRKSSQVYDPDKRYVHHSDKRGHYIQISLRLPTPVAGQISEIVASKMIPEYRRSSDVIADAVVHHLHRLSEELDDGTIRKTLNLTVMLDDAERQKHDRETFEKMVRTIDENCQALVAEPGRLREYCLELLAQASFIPPQMKGRYVETVERHLKVAGLESSHP